MRTYIENKPDIVDVVRDEGIHLTQKGKHFWAACPFHSEKTPSFAVSPERQIYKCFGCGESGDVIAFVMKSRGITFKEALKVLGISSPQPPSKGGHRNPESDRRRKLVEEFHEWCGWYRHECLELIGIVDRIERAIDDPAYLSLESISRAFLARFVAQYHVWILTGSFDTEEALEIYREHRGIR